MAFQPGVIFIGLTATIVVLIAIVIVLEKMTKKHKDQVVASPVYEYTEELQAIKNADLEPQEMMTRIDALAKKALGQVSAGHMDYSQIADSNKEKHHIVKFCTEMSESLYAGEKVNAAQVRTLIGALEDLLKGEGKIVLIKPKKEILEGKKSTFFLDRIIENAAKKVNARIQKFKEKEESKSASGPVEAKPAPEEQITMKEDKMPEFKKEVIIKKQKGKAKPAEETKEYKYIESVDVLDRIQNKIKDRKTVKI